MTAPSCAPVESSKTLTVTLTKIRSYNPCREGWGQVLKSRGDNPDFDQEFPLTDIITSNCLDHAIWAMRCVDKIHAQRFAIGCAKLVLHLMKDQRSIDAVAIAERYVDGHATLDELIECKHKAAAAAADAYAAYAAYAAAAYAADVAADAAYAAAADAAAADAAAYAAYAADDAAYAAYAARNAARKEMRSKQETLLRQICGEVQQ